MSYKDKKEAVIVAGANGSGKTTFARQFLDITKYEFLNADEIAKELSPEDPSKARIVAGKKVLSMLGELISQGKSFVIESTLSGSFLEKYIEELKENGYEIKLIYIFLASQKLCIERIKSRVLQGGHDIPDEDVRRRYTRGLVRFWNQYRLISDYFTIVFNNEYYDFKRVAYGKSEQIEVIDKDLYEVLLKQIKEIKNES